MLVELGRALLSVTDRSGLLELVKVLEAAGVELIASGGTAAYLERSGFSVTPVTSLTEFPEILDGRVKTLHPAVFGPILADPELTSHQTDIKTHQLQPIDLVVVNFYPFSHQPETEQIDVGGPALVRAAAKNHQRVAVLTHPDQYPQFCQTIASTGGTELELRKELASAAFAATSRYDADIHTWLWSGQGFADRALFSLEKVADLRYGENPHQSAALYQNAGAIEPLWVQTPLSPGAKSLSYNNVADAEAAYGLANHLNRPACVIVKHHNPCGVAQSERLATALQQAWASDPLSAFGSVIATNRPFDLNAAQTLTDLGFVELLVVPALTEDASRWLAEHKPKLSIYRYESKPPSNLEWHSRSGVWMTQTTDPMSGPESWELMTSPFQEHSDDYRQQQIDLEMAWLISAYTKSNAMVLVRSGVTVGIGAGNQSRVGAARMAIIQAKMSTQNAVAATDGFFPFPDALELLSTAGVKAVVAPRGSKKDNEMVSVAEELGLELWFSRFRHFRH